MRHDVNGAAPPISSTWEWRRKRKGSSGRWNMACTYTRRVREMTAFACVFSALIAACVMLQPASAKPGHLRVITDGNWEEILTGEWMIELWVIRISCAKKCVYLCMVISVTHDCKWVSNFRLLFLTAVFLYWAQVRESSVVLKLFAKMKRMS